MKTPKTDYTFSSLKNGDIEKIPETPGVYFVTCHKDYDYSYLTMTEGIKSYKGKSTVKTIDVLKGIGDKHKRSGSTILYIGKADNLQVRIRQYMNWGYNVKDNPHSGGKMLWQLKNNKLFNVSYIEIDDKEDPEKIETHLIDQHIIEYHCKPFANEKRGKKEYWLISKKEEKELYGV